MIFSRDNVENLCISKLHVSRLKYLKVINVYFTIKLEHQREKPSCRLHKGLKSTDVN